MIIKEYYEAKKHFKHGDKVWACAFSYTYSKEGRKYFQKPVLGMLMAGSNQAGINRIMERQPGYTGVNYFIPFKKNSEDLAWSKAVEISSRCYATTKTECIKLYNSLVSECIDWHKSCINELEKEIISNE